MATTSSWAWQGSGNWPGFSAASQSPVSGAGNGLAISPNKYTVVTWNDANNDGVISDSDKDDGAGNNGDTVGVSGINKIVKDVGIFTNSKLTIGDQVLTVPMVVWVFEDGSYVTRINDADIPDGVHHDAVKSITLGTWNSSEYSGSFVATRDDSFLCFTSGTLIQTPCGPRPIDGLAPGDLVLTRDHGAQPLRWIGQRHSSGRGAQAPVRIRAGHFGATQDLLLSPQHRILIGGWQSELFFGERETLAAASHLVGGQAVSRAPMACVTYLHLLFDRHQILSTHGVWSESFHPCDYSLTLIDAPQRAEVLSLFPDLASQPMPCGPAARPCLKRHEAACLVPSPA